MNEETDGRVESTKERNRSPYGRDVVVMPWRGAWAVVRVGNERPGRVRPTKDAAVRDGLSYARAGKARCFVTDKERELSEIATLLEPRQLDTEGGLGHPVLDARNLPGRRELRRKAILRAVEAGARPSASPKRA